MWWKGENLSTKRIIPRYISYVGNWVSLVAGLEYGMDYGIQQGHHFTLYSSFFRTSEGSPLFQ